METFPPNPHEYETDLADLSEKEQQLRDICFRVMSKCCQNCLFGPDKLVSDERKAAILQQCESQETFFVCHEASERGQKVCYRAFFELYKDQLPWLRVVQFYGNRFPGSLRFVDPHGSGEEGIDVS